MSGWFIAAAAGVAGYVLLAVVVGVVVGRMIALRERAPDRGEKTVARYPKEMHL